MAGFDTLIVIQVIYIAILFFTIRASHKQGRKAFFHWFIAGVYLLTLLWLVWGYIDYKSNNTGAGGGIAAIEMYAILIPGILVFISQFVYQVSSGIKNNGQID